MEKIEKFTLINKDRSRIKVFERFEDVSKPSPNIEANAVTTNAAYCGQCFPELSTPFLSKLELLI